MKNYITVKVEVEHSASHIETFYEKVNATTQAPLTQAIYNVAKKLKLRGVKYPHQLNYSAW
tara:strand:- start:90 stop:272 length:183 start_codon:yes stop_codon:yes gene_type:complete